MAETVITVGSRYGLRVDFRNEADILEWFKAVQAAGFLPPAVEIFQADHLDMNSTSVSPGRTRVIRDANSRNYGKPTEK